MSTHFVIEQLHLLSVSHAVHISYIQINTHTMLTYICPFSIQYIQLYICTYVYINTHMYITYAYSAIPISYLAIVVLLLDS